MRISDWTSDVCSSDLWSDGGRRLHWSRGATLLSADLANLFANAHMDEKAPKFTPPTEGVSLSMTREAAKHEGVVVITGAKIVTKLGRASCRERVCQYV